MKRDIEVFDYAGAIFGALPTGALVVTEAEECANAMTIGWGSLGIEWGTRIFTIYVRESRFTRELLDRSGEFVAAFPYGDQHAAKVKKALGICGSKSGRDTDKLAMAGLTLVDSEIVQPSAIKEFPLTLECRVVFSQVQPANEISSRFKNFYPPFDEEGNADSHIAYYGEILKSYIIE